jgi:hypothetical protein
VLVPGPAPEIFVILEEALASHFTPEVAAFVRVVFSLYDPDELRGLMADARGVPVAVRVLNAAGDRGRRPR